VGLPSLLSLVVGVVGVGLDVVAVEVVVLTFLGVEGAVSMERGWGFPAGGNMGVCLGIDVGCIVGVDRFER
jgi:hypothetical protein